ncbi:MAG: PDZ domain-containing protein [Actinomycetota bacterium]|nr:PDZ domain-containing protein [Actinomycetota bacterium]
MRRWRVASGAVVLLVLVTWIVTAVRLPVLVISPGTALPVGQRVEFPTRPEDELSGKLLLTTVRISQPNTLEALGAWLDNDENVVPREHVIPEGMDAEEYFRAQREVFEQSGQLAAAAGLRAAGETVSVLGEGVQVLAVLPDAPAAGALRPGDVITAAGGKPVGLAPELVAVVASRKIGDKLDLTVRRGGTTRNVEVTVGSSEQQPVPALGIAVGTVGFDIELPFPVEVDADDIGGPSAGLLIALTVYDLADAGDLTAGRIIAGTGTIDGQGNVGPVGGVTQKIEAAVDAGAQIFLAPPEEVEQARAAAGARLRIVEVATLQEAIEALGSQPS